MVAINVEALMLRDLVSAPRTTTVGQARALLRSARLRHLPVVDHGILIGLVSYRDVLEASVAALCRYFPGEEDPLSTVSIEGLLRGEPSTIAAEASLEDAASRMLALRLGCLPVTSRCTQGQRLEGLVTEAGLLRAAYLPRPPHP